MKHHTYATRLFCTNLVTTLLTLLVITCRPLTAAPLGTAFTYQGRLNSGAAPASGNYDLRFAVFDAAASGSQVGAALTNAATPVANGLFTVTLDFGAGVFNGSARWLEIAVRPAGGGAFTLLTPRQPLAPAPHALYAPTAGAAATATSAQAVLPNAVTSAGIASGQVVKSLNGLKDAVRLAAGPNVMLATNANTLTISAAGGGADGGWTTTGNAGTTPADNFLGTTDGQPLILQANNVGVNTNDPQAALHVNGTVRATRFEGDGGGLAGINASLPTPFTLTNLANVQLGGVARGVAIKDHYAILANGYDGVRVFDIADPAHPVAVAHVSDLQADAWTVAIAGVYAFVGTSSGLIVLEVSWPPLADEISRLDTEAGVGGVAIGGGGLILANDTEGMRTCYVWSSGPGSINVSTASVTNNGGRAWGVAVAGDLAFLANEADGLRIYSVSNFAKPVMLGHAKTPDRAFGVAAAPGNLVYVASGYDGLLIYDVSNPSVPALVHTIPGAGAEARRVTISGQWALVAWNHEGIRAYDISAPRNPVEVAHAPLVGDGFSLDVTLSGAYAFAANEIGGLGTYLASPMATVPGIVNATGFAGDGSKLTQLDASQLTGQLPASLASGLWQVSGNAGTSPGQSYLGTTDNQPLEFKVNDRRALRLEPSAISPNLIGGYAGNGVSNGVVGATIGGGGNSSNPNRVGGSYATVVGGEGNTASGSDATAMGFTTAASGHFSTAMGLYTRAMGERSTAMGDGTTASGFVSTAMGFLTTASGEASTAMGFDTTASGTNSFAAGSNSVASGRASFAMGMNAQATNSGAVAFGADTLAGGPNSFAMGTRAKALHEGAFVWAGNQTNDFSSTASNQFLIQADGGVGIGIANPSGLLHVSRRSTMSDSGVPHLWLNDDYTFGYARLRFSVNNDTSAYWDVVADRSRFLIHSKRAGRNLFELNTIADAIFMGASVHLDSRDLFLRGSVDGRDATHGLGWFGSGKPFAGKAVDGPVLYGLNGGGLGTKAGGDNLVLAWTSAGQVGINNTNPTAGLDVIGNLRINDGDIFLRGGHDTFHGLGWYGETMPFGGQTPDGPVLYGHNGGVLGTAFAGNRQWTLAWNKDGNVSVRGTLAQGSDRDAKADFGPVDARAVLEKVAALPVQTWRYKTEETGTRHLGPVSQDFHAAFGLGANDKTITTVDEGGVALAAIQGLNLKLSEELTRRDAENAELKARLDKLEQLLERRR